MPLLIITSAQTFERNKMNTSTAFIVLVCLLVLEVKSQSLPVKGRCISVDKGLNKVSPKAIKMVEIFPPSHSCKRLEIV
ncbi:C-X-C motif chemokine 11-6 [Labeo rohita]|uniref:C-X-C motif chemokine 11-6 n=1 Tax=Labeo rohita TaxID=84645 RepID=A0ABQ8MNY6_LABRO|nr:C-X-C motif chemokine 11-6 [Labeo rohita]